MDWSPEFLKGLALIVLTPLAFWITWRVTRYEERRVARQFADHMRGVGGVDGDWVGHVGERPTPLNG